jgi:hypothetical protein
MNGKLGSHLGNQLNALEDEFKLGTSVMSSWGSHLET